MLLSKLNSGGNRVWSKTIEGLQIARYPGGKQLAVDRWSNTLLAAWDSTGLVILKLDSSGRGRS
jgi:hypothetical protein